MLIDILVLFVLICIVSVGILSLDAVISYAVLKTMDKTDNEIDRKIDETKKS